MLANVRMKRYDDKAEDVLVDEWLQLVCMGVYSGLKAQDLSHGDNHKAVRLVQLVKEKRWRKIKGSMCAVGRITKILHC